VRGIIERITMTNLSREAALSVARAALPSFGIGPDASVDFVKHRENVVFRVADAQGTYALRVHRHGHRSDAEVRTENAYMLALREAGVPVSEVVPAANGELFAVAADGQGRKHQVDVQRWVEDSAPLGDAGDAWSGLDCLETGVFEKLGEFCARFHLVSRELGAVPGYSRQAWDADGLVGQDPLWGDPRGLAETEDDRAAIGAAMDAIRRTLKNLGTAPDVYGVIHSDFTPENILLARGELTLIDFDDFGEGWWLFDLATVLFWYHRHPRAKE
jgi:Ser/Thr protein kinase RdoA (MazF antagonist)